MSSITCCSELAESTPNRLEELRSNYQSDRSSVHGFSPDLAVKRAAPTRRRREFTPDELKDETYWLKRSRNNESAKRSRLRRRMEESLLEARAVELLRENEKLKAALSTIHYHNNNGFKNNFSGDMRGQGPHREAYPAPSLSGTDGACCGFSSRAQIQYLSPNYDSTCLPGMETFPTPKYISACFLDNQVYQRDRTVGCQLGIPSYRDGNTVCPSLCGLHPVSLAYDDMCQSLGLSDMSKSTSKSLSSNHITYHPGPPQSHSEIVEPHGPNQADNGPGYGVALIQAQDPSKTPVMSRATKEIAFEMKAIHTETQPAASGTPLLPHKLRYKASRASKA